MKERQCFNIVILLGLIISVSFGIFYLETANSRYASDDFIYWTKEIKLKTDKIQIGLELPRPDIYTLKLKYERSKGDGLSKEVVFEGNSIKPGKSKTKGAISSIYYRIDAGAAEKPNNPLYVDLLSSWPMNVDLRFYNYIAGAFEGNLHIVDSRSCFWKGNPHRAVPAFLFAAAVLFLWLGFYGINRKFTQSPNTGLMISLVIFLPYLSLFAIIWGACCIAGVRFILSPGWLFTSICILLCMAEFFMLSAVIALLLTDKKKSGGIYSVFLNHNDFNRQRLPPVLLSIAVWVSSLGVYDKCILAAVILISSCGIMLTIKLEALANITAIAAYVLLIFAIPAKFVLLCRSGL